ncbi:MAG: 3-deoxy-D-manno-octulosonic acid transferase [Bacteroidota bacterium]
MMLFYNLFIRTYSLLISLASITGNRKASAFIKGRKDWEKELRAGTSHDASPWVMFHCASLGEFEQGRPLIESYRSKHPGEKILVSFFSPSGYELRKNYEGADYVCYLPLDTARNAKTFIEIVQPSKVFFIKYEFWFNLLEELHVRSIPHFVVSGIFRPSQWIFKSINRSFLNRLSKIDYFFLQDNASVELLACHGIRNTIITGDTRFDRVVEVATKPAELPEIENWCKTGSVIVAGSTWLEDEQALLGYMKQKNSDVKLLLVPHEINNNHLQRLEQEIGTTCPTCSFQLYSKTDGKIDSDILIMDSIGLLSRLYRFATVAYVGGGFGSGIHNTLEAAVYGKPVVFGPRYEKFREAVDLIEKKAAFGCKTTHAVSDQLSTILVSDSLITAAGNAAKAYVLSRTGATAKILERL